jgi:hypothetical protein
VHRAGPLGLVGDAGQQDRDVVARAGRQQLGHQGVGDVVQRPADVVEQLAQQVDALVDEAVPVLDEPVGVERQQRAGREREPLLGERHRAGA